jgi:hypothetical protein
MSSDLFSITKHKVPSQHIREYPRATAGEQEDVQYLEVKQYIPLNNASPSPGDVTLIAAHANGFPKVSLPLKDLTRSSELINVDKGII